MQQRKDTTSFKLGLVCTLALCAMSLNACSKADNNSNNPDEIPIGKSECTRDESKNASSSVALSLDAPTSGFVCPAEDQDWYSFDVPASDRIISLGLKLSTAISPVELTYAIWSSKADGTPEQAVAIPPSTQIGQALDDVHCVTPGKHFIVVRDEGDDNQDTRHPYELVLKTLPDPDGNEPNDAQDAAKALTSGQTVMGAIACRGDEDWFQITVPEDNLIRLQLSSPVSKYQPMLRVLDEAGDLIVLEENKSGTVKATAIDRFEVVPKAGTYFVVVSDNDNKQADPDVNYSLSFELIQDGDPNEPNNNPDEATPLANNTISCVGNNGMTFTATGTIGSPGDDDWFRIPLEGCRNGIIEAEVEFPNSSWEFNAKVQATLTLIRGQGRSTCTRDEDCTALDISCQNNLDCAGYFETCLPQGLCAGSTNCLPEGVCGANIIQRRYECKPSLDECKPDQPAPKNLAKLSSPLFGQNFIYLRVSDFQSNGADPGALYTLRAKIRLETDANEPNNVFTNVVPENIPVNAHQALSTEIPVHDCTNGDCCDGSTWVEGNLGYEGDLDWFRYKHPCPGEDCTMRFVYDVAAGPVDFVTNIYRDQQLWFTGFDIEELPNQTAKSGALGGTTAQDRCFYAYQKHTSNMSDFYYYVVVRDLFGLYSDKATVDPSTREFAPDQRYRFCVEKIANSCLEPPCKVYDDGCGQPQ